MRAKKRLNAPTAAIILIGMDDPRWWTSLADQRAVAAALYGRPGEDLLAQWLGEQLARITDLDFARTFCDQVGLPGIEPGAYAHRVVSTQAGTALGGIRFYSRDVSRPFVDVLAHTFADLHALRDCVRAEWRIFEPRFLRLATRPGGLTGPSTVPDLGVHAARYADMTPQDGRVRLTPFPAADDAIDMVAERYRRLASDQPALARRVFPADAEQLRDWHRTGRLVAVRADDLAVGALAVAPDAVSWLSGDVVCEEVIAPGQGGHGYAASAQAAWAARADDPRRLLIGTIDRRNMASCRTAERAGRPRVLDWTFVELGFPAGATWQ